MKTRIVTTLIGIFFITGITFAQPAKDTQKDEPEPKVEWVSLDHDFGEIPQGTPVKATFEFKNISKEPVIISNVRSSCGCTVAGYDKEPILPGKSSSITATYNAAKAGAFSKTVTVIMHDNTQHRLRIEGKVVVPQNK